ncbi:hypothetical protein KUL113_16270 [Tenacibaculum sp. KUL113]|nr:hypothetical protein KUL113_16270 [Tenacibaculum sp. KUL113]
MSDILDFFGGLVGKLIIISLGIGWFYWLWLAIKYGGFFMFVVGLLPITAPFSAVLGLWCFFDIPDWVSDFFM